MNDLLINKLEEIALSRGFHPDHKAAVLQALVALDRAYLSHYDRDARHMLRLLQDADISVGKACEWLRHWILDGVQDPLPTDDEIEKDKQYKLKRLTETLTEALEMDGHTVGIHTSDWLKVIASLSEEY